jgi:hypothetical protein
MAFHSLQDKGQDDDNLAFLVQTNWHIEIDKDKEPQHVRGYGVWIMGYLCVMDVIKTQKR